MPMAFGRRSFLASGAAATLGMTLPVRAKPSRPRLLTAADFDRIVADFVADGDHRTGGKGDLVFAERMATTLNDWGLSVERQSFKVPQFFLDRAFVENAGVRIDAFPQWPARPMQGAIEARLSAFAPGGKLAKGSIALVRFPYRPQAVIQPYWPILEAAAKAGAVAAIAVTEGQTGEIIAMNAPIETPPLPLPTLLVGAKDAPTLDGFASNGAPARVVIDGRFNPATEAFNTIARLDRGRPQTIAVSTPASGWFACGGERGPGIALFLALARWAIDVDRRFNWLFVNTSGHELGHAGMDHFLDHHPALPPKDACRMWIHLGACIATHDFHTGFGRMSRLPSVFAQRYVTGQAGLLPALRSAFAGLPGLEVPYEHRLADAGGELRTILPKTNYENAITLFGGMYYFHTPKDDATMTSGRLIAPVADALYRFVESL